MKNSLPLLIAGLCVVGSLQAVAATGSWAAKEGAPPWGEHQTKPVRTADFGFATPELIPLDSQTMQSQGGSLRPGPRNRHLTPPHGGPVHPGDRGDMPGRS